MSRTRSLSLIALALALAIPPASEARRMAVRTRPLRQFLDAQGTTTTFFVHPDISGWVDRDIVTFALVDYPGVIADWLRREHNVDLGTTVTGSVLEWELADGRALIAVMLSAENALGFAQATKDLIESGFDWEGTPEVFGSKASGVAAGATPALGRSHLLLSFIISKPGAQLPNMLDVLNDPVYYPASIALACRIAGEDADGEPAALSVLQAGQSRDGQMEWSSEVVTVEKLGR